MITCTSPGCRRPAAGTIKKLDRLGRRQVMPRCETCLQRRNEGNFKKHQKKDAQK